MGRGCAWKWLLRLASLYSHGAGFVHAELLSLLAGYLLALCTASRGAGGWGSTAGGENGGACVLPPGQHSRAVSGLGEGLCWGRFGAFPGHPL